MEMNELKLVLASRNAHKIKEIETILRDYLPGVTLLSLDDVGILDEIEENGTTFAENALIKAKAAAKSGYIAFADDSGLVVPALDNAPGIYSARYAGIHGDDKANRDLLLKNLQGNPNREAAFVCAIACVLPEGEPFVVHGVAEGEILCEERGNGGFGYDCLFWSDYFGKSFAEMTPEEKNAISHRRRALEAFAVALAERLGWLPAEGEEETTAKKTATAADTKEG